MHRQIGVAMRYRMITFLTILLGLSIAAWAVTPQFWEDFSQEDLLKGNLNHVSLAPDGRLFMASAYDLVFDTGQAYIFSMVRDKAGNIYVGTGDEGKVFKIDPQGKGSLFFQTKELDIFALALDSSDVLYVGTSPDGKVYKVTAANQGTEFCDPATKYIWSMIFDAAGNLYIGTGANGTIYKVDKSGQKSSFYTCSDTHVVTLARDNGNNILAGTSPGGLVIQIKPDGKGFTLMDTLLEEVHSLSTDRFGTIYALASSAKGLGTAATTTKPATGTAQTAAAATATVTIESVTVAPEKKKETKAVTAPGSEKETTDARSAIYAITTDGAVETIYSSKEQMVYDAVLRGDGSLLVATGPKGRLLSVDSAKQVTVLTDTPEEDVTRLLAVGDTVYAGASNQGKVYKLLPHRAQAGTFESNTLDAKIVSSWGKISWRNSNPAGGGIELSTRSGNTEKADGSWSEWSAPYSAPEQQISSPRARYLQWRATFKGGSGAESAAPPDVLEKVAIAYLQQNLRPQVVSIDVLPYGVELQKQPALTIVSLNVSASSTSSDGRSLNSPRERGRDQQPITPRQVLQPGAQSFTWKATDDNDDTLEYALYFKGEGESDWKLLEKKITDTFYTLNAAALPDGIYRLKVVASDAPNNPYDKFLIGELISDPFVIANTSPRLDITANKVSGKKVEVQFRASVTIGRIATAEFSIDGGDWNLIFPVDGIADSAQEEYRFTTPELSVGEHLLGLRASDRDGDTGTAKLVVKIQ
jgi:hypothetical protein